MTSAFSYPYSCFSKRSQQAKWEFLDRDNLRDESLTQCSQDKGVKGQVLPQEADLCGYSVSAFWHLWPSPDCTFPKDSKVEILYLKHKLTLKHALVTVIHVNCFGMTQEFTPKILNTWWIILVKRKKKKKAKKILKLVVLGSYFVHNHLRFYMHF